jgi:hypothetical protein
VSVAGVLAAAAVATVITVAAPFGSPAAPPIATAAVLSQAAMTAAEQPAGAAMQPGRYLYVETIETIARGPSGFTQSQLGGPPAVGQGFYECTMIQKLWLASNGSARVDLLPYPGQGAKAAGKCTAFSYSSAAGYLPPGLALPTDPARLERAVEQRFADGKPDATTFAAVCQLLESGESPAIRAALYHVLQLLPGIQNMGPSTDRLGRHGIAIGYTYAGTRYELIFDPVTSAVLETSGTGPGGATGFTIYLASGVVRSDTATLPTPRATAEG